MSKTFPVTMGRTGIQMIENLQVYDMVWGMCNLNRFTGKGDRQVSNAIHSLHCYEIARIWQPDNYDLQLYALLHDLPEAYYGDFPGFLKKELGPDFELALEQMDDIILTQMGLPLEVRIKWHDDLKRIDNNALAIEAAYAFTKFEPYHWPEPDLYEKDDILSDLVIENFASSFNTYNHLVDTLESFGDKNETLADLLHRHRSYSHPRYGSYFR